jgi:hypothetical protein
VISEGTSIEFHELKNSATVVTYDDLFRNNELHIGKLVHFRGEVIQVQPEKNDRYQLRINVTEDSFYWTDTVLVQHSGQRLLESDIVEFVAEVLGLHTYSAIFGNEVTLPHLLAIRLQLEREIPSGDVTVIPDSDRTSVPSVIATVEPAPTSTPAPGYSRTVPVSIGTPVEVSDTGATVVISVQSVVRGGEAWSMIQDANQFHDPPPEDQEYLLARVRIHVLSTLHPDDLVNLHRYQLKAVSESGRVYEQFTGIGPQPVYHGELFVGGTLSGWAVFTVDVSDLNPVLRYEFARQIFGSNSETPLWFKLGD